MPGRPNEPTLRAQHANLRVRLASTQRQTASRSFLIAIATLHLTTTDPPAPAFEDITAESGLDFVHWNGMSGALYAPEHMGPGVALLDYDRDGDLDVFLGQGNPIVDSAPTTRFVFPPPGPLPLTDRLYRNDLEVRPDGSRRLRFTDVTAHSGLATTTGYNMGVATGDYDGDGWVDLYVTNLGPNHLLRNNRDGTFTDRTAAAGADDRRLSVPASFFDYDGDGWLDLFVGNYNDFRLATDKPCYTPDGALDYCGPLAYTAEPPRLLHNRGDGTFEDATVRAGLAGTPGTALGSLAADWDGDGQVDLYVANDLMANRMWINQGGGRFADDALLRGTAFDRDGRAQASMGLVAGDINGDGAIDLFMTHLTRDYNTLYLNDGNGLFRDASNEAGLARPSWPFTGFGTALFDYDGDGDSDLYVANGAVQRLPEQLAAGDPHPLKQRNQLFSNRGDGTFVEVPDTERESAPRTLVGRGLAVGDLDNDGHPDLVLTTNAGPASVLRNTRDPGARWLGLRLVDGRSGADVYGAIARLGGAQGRRWSWVHTDGSYAAASDPRLLFALPSAAPQDVWVRWPDGHAEVVPGLEPGRYHVLARQRE